MEGTVNSKMLLDYLKQVFSFLIKHHGLKKEKTLILWITHLPSSKHNDGIPRFLWYIYCLYSYILFRASSGWKCFRVLKGYVNKRETNKNTNFNSKQGVALISKSIRQIDLITVRRMWRTFFKEMKVCLDHFSNLI